MSNLPTAEEWLKHFEENAYPNTPISECMIEFAKLHVEAALKAVDKKAEYEFSEEAWEDITDKDFILKTYPLKNII